jgi:hypothetical protein
VPPVKRGDWNAPRVRLDLFDEGVLHLSNVGQPRGGLHRNMTVPELAICSMIEPLDNRPKELLVVDPQLDLVDEGFDAGCPNA